MNSLNYIKLLKSSKFQNHSLNYKILM